ncbi:uncharacterized protein LOC124161432 [Ischnura elegans]|uniref:uncharacterized protein LOC124161432 n=1 Tax=Ischnura elegans TaxID=197161 RepID=UPI001ED8753D|nr:uncharacterized protein LOC124161432 [Ischnura elegans]
MWTLSVTAFAFISLAKAGISVPFDNTTATVPENWEGHHETLAKLMVQRLNSGGWSHGNWEMDTNEAGLRVQRVLNQATWGPQRKKGEAPPTQAIVSGGGGSGEIQVGGGGGGGVSETDLYLLGAIEKLAKKVERMEQRLQRAEEALYYVTEGQQKPQAPYVDAAPCREGFIRAGRNCYLFGRRPVDWKSANTECRKAGALPAELETTEEGSAVASTIISRTDLRGADYWTGGLNPGLLWIWSHSGRPVSAPLSPGDSQANGVVSPGKGGRCLKLSFKPTGRSGRYAYEGADCGARLRYVCEDSGPDGEGPAGNAIRRWERERRLLAEAGNPTSE